MINKTLHKRKKDTKPIAEYLVTVNNIIDINPYEEYELYNETNNMDITEVR
jgi:hypothetical protein